MLFLDGARVLLPPCESKEKRTKKKFLIVLLRSQRSLSHRLLCESWNCFWRVWSYSSFFCGLTHLSSFFRFWELAAETKYYVRTWWACRKGAAESAEKLAEIDKIRHRIDLWTQSKIIWKYGTFGNTHVYYHCYYTTCMFKPHSSNSRGRFRSRFTKSHFEPIKPSWGILTTTCNTGWDKTNPQAGWKHTSWKQST